MLKEVYFYQYCDRCKYRNAPETDFVCDDCLCFPAREDSHKPEYFIEDPDYKPEPEVDK